MSDKKTFFAEVPVEWDDTQLVNPDPENPKRREAFQAAKDQAIVEAVNDYVYHFDGKVIHAFRFQLDTPFEPGLGYVARCRIDIGPDGAYERMRTAFLDQQSVTQSALASRDAAIKDRDTYRSIMLQNGKERDALKAELDALRSKAIERANDDSYALQRNPEPRRKPTRRTRDDLFAASYFTPADAFID